jgi:GTP pyrophosphokinase
MAMSQRFEDALQFAARLHATQKRKGSDTPYIAHLLAVTAIALEYGATEDEAIAALLHDAVEDQGGAPRLEEIRDRFGDPVATIVQGLTDTDEMHKPSWRPRKERYIAHLRQSPYSVRFIAVADKLHNVQSVLTDYQTIGEDLWSRFTGGREGTLWFYRAVLAALQSAERPNEARLNALIAELDEAVDELERAASERRPRSALPQGRT